uniref:Late embryogenesis abundant protein LEA-2 subgroup domain-containing protein n=1 Tax=Leersia perrieri TaxID=77586 RepID=A0A0D9WDP8_9ORYZ
MADRVYPAAKPNPPPAMASAANGAATASFPAPKSQMYQRPIYRPQSVKRRRGRSCRCSFCCCFCWALLIVILLAFAAAVAGGAIYLLYRPHRPTFTVSSVKLAALNLSTSPTSASLTDAISVSVVAKNPNKKVVYFYDDFSFSASTAANSVPLGSATSPGFTHDAGNTTVFTATIAANSVSVDPDAAGKDIKKSGSFSVAVDAETRAGVKLGSIKTKKIGIQVHCEGIKVTPPAPKAVKGKNGTLLAPAPAPVESDTTATTATVSTAAHSCNVRVRVKIWKWTF